MSGESIPVYGATVGMITSGPSLADTVMTTSGDVFLDYTGSHDLCDVVFEGSFSIAPAINSTLNIYMRKLASKGANDDPVPDTNFKKIYVGNINLDNISTTMTITSPRIPILPDCQLYIENTSGQTLSAGWTLDIKPFGYGVAP